MDIEWENIRKAIENKDNIAIAEAKTEVLDYMEKQADSLTKRGGSLQGITASTFHWNESKLNKNKSDLILQFKQELLYSFMQRHGMSIYHDSSCIKSGDAIVIKHKRLILAYDVVDAVYPNISIRLVKLVKGDTPTNIETIKISKQNFMFGIGLNQGTLKINHKSFFFFYNKI
ncbi:hypothetical protein [Bacteroides caccae]|uniref:hypothetical protein n=1 Tax=Bacteroides caccae TaxID=47678 RepID=UPI0035628EF2